MQAHTSQEFLTCGWDEGRPYLFSSDPSVNLTESFEGTKTADNTEVGVSYEANLEDLFQILGLLGCH
ncbi:hypothetical protein J0S82_016533, partial [Galemys pyrenaicus]